LEKANEIALTYIGDSVANEVDYFGDPAPQMKLNFSINNGFILNIECYTMGDPSENYVSLSFEEAYKYLKIILNVGVIIYDILYQDILEIGYVLKK
jgi:hypothetical protein